VTTVVTVMDRPGGDANTDNVVVVDPRAHLLLWIPRDLYCEQLKDRINAAFPIGRRAALLRALGEHGFDVSHSLCMQRPAVEAVFSSLTVTVPVDRPMSFWYPREPQQPIEDGRKLIRFDPPAETLFGERLHQWIGARYQPDGPSNDLDRMKRQQVLLRQLLLDGFDFTRVLQRAEWISISDHVTLSELAQAAPTWSFATFENLVPRIVSGKDVLVRSDAIT
jgi:anionic cell wall polymer biosynthesis LytR-Cps2A-Psr (LCP) family protein